MIRGRGKLKLEGYIKEEGRHDGRSVSRGREIKIKEIA